MKNQLPEVPVLQAFKVNLSKGNPLPCDADELPKIVLAIKTGSPCKIRRGLFNPSYYISITEDHDRIVAVQRENGMIRQHNEHVERTGGTDYQEYKGMQQLKDIFEGIDLSTGSQLQKPTTQDQLPSAPPKEEGEYKRVGR